MSVKSPSQMEVQAYCGDYPLIIQRFHCVIKMDPLFSKQIHLMTFQGTRYCAKDPSLVSADEIKAARGELEPPRSENKGR